MSKILIRSGHLVTASDDYTADILIEGERIVAIGQGLSALAEDADRVIDAAGKYVFPGAVDVHTHLDLPLPLTNSSDDFETGTIAAACGGTTTIIDFANQYRGQTLAYALESWHGKAQGKAAVDYGFHITITDLTSAPERAMADMVREGVTSFKLLMAYPDTFMVDDETIFKVLRRSSDLGALVCVHAENGCVIDLLVREAVAAGQTGPAHHAHTRPALLEGEATERAIALAKLAGAPVYIVHVSCEAALNKIIEARGRGEPVWAETCPQYLFLSEEKYELPDFEAAKYVCTPPLRKQTDAAALWAALERGDLDAVSTDHCPFFFNGQKDLGRDDFTKIPNGLPGIETRVGLIYSGGVGGKRFDLQHFVDLVATRPAKLFGLYPRKGTIAVGSDADLVLFDPEREEVLSAASHHMRVDYNPYEGTKIKGSVRTVLLRGQVIVEEGAFIGHAGQGRFLKRATL